MMMMELAHQRPRGGISHADGRAQGRNVVSAGGKLEGKPVCPEHSGEARARDWKGAQAS